MILLTLEMAYIRTRVRAIEGIISANTFLQSGIRGLQIVQVCDVMNAREVFHDALSMAVV